MFCYYEGPVKIIIFPDKMLVTIIFNGVNYTAMPFECFVSCVFMIG